MKRSIVGMALLALGFCQGTALAGPPFELVDGDRVVLIGGTLIERDQEYGYLEARLIRRYPGRSITFRNLGWSGDTVEGPSRARFGTVEEGFQHLVEHVLALKPTVVIVGYGGNESFEGKVGLAKFLQGFDRLLKAIEPTRARLVILSPTPQENLGPPLPDPGQHNKDLALYRDALQEEASKRGAAFVDLYQLLSPPTVETNHRRPLTDNGLHFTAYGSWKFAAAVERGLGLPQPWNNVKENLGAYAKSVAIEFPTRIEDLKETPGGLKFRLIDEVLPLTPPPGQKPKASQGVGVPEERNEDGSVIGRFIAVTGLKPGRYVLQVDGKPIDTVTFTEDANGKSSATVTRVVEFNQVEALRSAINAKNQLYFYRWRPQNETYLLGFRKHEQGRNAKEIVEFDPLVAAKEAEIARLRVPVPHVYELIREGEAGR